MRKPDFCICENNSDFILDFGKLPFSLHLGKCFIHFGKKITKIHKIGKIKTTFGLGMTPLYGGKNIQIKSLNKEVDQLRGNLEADQHLCFCYIDSFCFFVFIVV